MNKKINILTVVFTVFLILARPVWAKIYIDISSPFMEKIPIALSQPELSNNTFENRQAAKKLTSILKSDLIFHGFFSVFDSPYQAGDEKIDYRVDTSMDRKGSSLSVVLKLVDLSTNSMLVGRRYLGTINDLRKMAHRFSNEIVKAITGRPGISLSRILFVSRQGSGSEVYSADFDGMNIRQETRQRSIVMSPRYSPDGRWITFTSFISGRPCLYLKDTKSGRIRKLSSYKGLNMSPAWAPSGDRLAVTLSRGGSPDIYLIDLNGRVLKRLTKGPGINCSPSFSPDGRRLVFVSDRNGSPQLFILELGSGKIKRLTFTGSYNTDPQWSPTGEKITYVSRIGGRFQIFTISPDGGDPTQLTFEANNENPSWSPDGRQILFSSTRTRGKKSLFVMFANGQNQRLLIDYGQSDYFPFWGPNNFK